MCRSPAASANEMAVSIARSGSSRRARLNSASPRHGSTSASNRLSSTVRARSTARSAAASCSSYRPLHMPRQASVVYSIANACEGPLASRRFRSGWTHVTPSSGVPRSPRTCPICAVTPARLSRSPAARYVSAARSNTASAASSCASVTSGPRFFARAGRRESTSQPVQAVHQVPVVAFCVAWAYCARALSPASLRWRAPARPGSSGCPDRAGSRSASPSHPR
jgi:hypothetical protein